MAHVEPSEYEALGEQIYPFEWQAARVYTTAQAREYLGWTPATTCATALP